MKFFGILFIVLILLFLPSLAHAQEIEQNSSDLQDAQEIEQNSVEIEKDLPDLQDTQEIEQNSAEIEQDLQDTQETEQEVQEPEEPSIITIENAIKVSYIDGEGTDADIIRFSGDVRITVEKGTSKTIIYSDLIDFDRSRNTLYAEGSIVMEQLTDGEITERLTADSLLLNTTTLEGVFNQGRVVQMQQESLNLSEGSTLIVYSDLFARDSSDAVTFKNGEITFCDDENPHWKIKASRIWLLPGNEFAFLNAVLYVGVLPVGYFPFFYYPKDELVFNPAFGYRAREGFFVQTTTYLIGRKPLVSEEEDDDDGDDDGDGDEMGFNFMKQTQLKEQELQGLILRNLDANATMPTSYLKIMADYYTTLGGMLGVEGAFKPNEVVTDIAFNARIGFSNVVFPVTSFPMYVSYYNDTRYPDYGWFFGIKLPFRYGGFFDTDIRADDFSLSVSIPLYSDPWFDEDFDDRQESMDWIDLLLGGLSDDGSDDDDDDDDAGISGYTWNISGSYTPKIPLIAPWVTTLSLTSFNSSIVFADQIAPNSDFSDDKNLLTNSPNRKFFYPSQVKPLSLSVHIAGTLVQWPPESATASTRLSSPNDSSTISNEAMELINKLSVPEDLSILDENSNNAINDDSQELTELNNTNEVDDLEQSLLSTDTLPNISISAPTLKETSNISYNLTYSIKPEFSTLLTYSGTKKDGVTSIAPSEFSLLDPKSSELEVKVPINITSVLGWHNSFISLTNSFDFTPQYQTHPILSSDYYDEAGKNQIILSDYGARKLDLSNTNKLSIKPLVYTDMFANTSINWNTSVDLVQTEFSGTIDDPLWDYHKPQWNSEFITEHNLNAVFEARQQDFSQKLTLQANLPPLVDSYTGIFALSFPVGSISLSTGYKKESLTSSEWNFQPISQSSTWTFFAKKSDGTDNPNELTFKQSFVYDIKENFSDSFSTSLSWRGLQLSYDMRYRKSQTLETTGWVPSDTREFLPFSLSLSWNVLNYEYTNKKGTVSIKPGISTAVSWDMVIPTMSSFSFKPSLSLTIKNFLTITFSAESENKALLRYLQGPLGFSPEIPGERNIFIDLFNSFAFWDEEKRASSGFKIKSFNLEIEHDLHDWTLSAEFEIEPRIIVDSEGENTFDYRPLFTLSVAWKPMSGMKTTIEDKHGTFTLNP